MKVSWLDWHVFLSGIGLTYGGGFLYFFAQMPPKTPRILASGAGVLALLFSLSACDRQNEQAERWRIERERVEVGQQLELAKLKLGMAASGDFEALEVLRAENERNEGLVVDFKGRRGDLQRELAELEQSAEDFRTGVLKRRRHEMLGTSFETLRVGSDRAFEQVSVLAIDDAGVSIRHLHGTARLGFSDLDAGQRIQFGLDEELAESAQKREAAHVAAYERQIDAELASLEEKKARRDSVAEREDRLASTRYQNLLASQRSSASVSTLSKPASTFGSGSYRYSSYRSYRPNYRYVYYQTPTPSYCRPLISIQTGRAVGVGCMSPIGTTQRRFSETTFTSTP